MLKINDVIKAWVEQLPKDATIISTCNDCLFYIKKLPGEHLCKSGVAGCPKSPPENFGCIHWKRL